MRFCSACGNMLFVNERDNGDFFFKCVKCNAIDETDVDSKSLVVSRTEYLRAQSGLQTLATPFVHDDPTIPHISSVACPSAECTKPPDSRNDVLYIKRDVNDMRFVYSCAHCRHSWTR